MKNLLPKVKKYSVFFLLVSSALLFASCSSQPSAGDGRQAIQNQINQDAQGRIKLLQFHKTNGQLAEISAVKVYGLEFMAEIEFTEDCKWITGFMGSQPGFRTSKLITQPSSGFSWQKFSDDAANPGVPVQKGQKMQVSGVIRFEKKEKGWWVDEVKVTSIVPAGQTAVSPGPAPQQSPLEAAKVGATKTQIGTFKTALDAYKVDTDFYPRSKNGLNDLIQRPRDARKWYGPYLSTDKLPKDPWGHDYIYECPGQHNPDSYDLMSMGPDGRVGGGDDISNWPQQSSQPRSDSPASVAANDQLSSRPEQPSPTDSDDPPTEAERWFRRRFGSTPEDVKVVAYRNTTEERFNDSYGEGCSLDFEAEFEVQNSTTENGVEVHRGDRVKYVGIIQDRKRERGWRFQSCRLHVVSASRDSLLAQIQAAQERSTSNNHAMWRQDLLGSASAGAPVAMPQDATNGGPWRLRFHNFTY